MPQIGLALARDMQAEKSLRQPVSKLRFRRLGAAGHFLLYQSGMLAVVVTTLAVWPLLGRLLAPALVGELSLQLAIASISAPALCLGAHLYLANRLASPKNLETGTETLTAVVITGTLYSVSLVAVGMSFVFEHSQVPVSLALSFAFSAYLVTSGVMRGVNRPALFGAFVVCVQILGLVGLGLRAAETAQLRHGVLIYVLLVGVPVAAQYLMLRDQLSTFNWRGVTKTLAKSASLVPHLVLAVALLMAMRILVSIQMGNQATANYTFASLVIAGSLTIGASLDAHWSVRAQASKTIRDLNEALLQSQRRIQAILMLVAVGVAAFLFLGLDHWLPAGYDKASVKLAVAFSLPAASIQAIADGRAAALMWTRRPGLISASTSLGTFTAIVLAYFLIPMHGWPMVGVALVAGLSLRALLTTYSTRVVCPQSRVGVVNCSFLCAQFVFAGILFANI